MPWREFDLKYADNFKSKKGQRAIDSRMALGALLIKPAYKAMSDEDITREIAMNPYLQYFLGLREYRYECPFDPSMMTRFRQRITAEMLSWVNNRIIGRKAEDEKHDNEDDSDGNGQNDENKESEGTPTEDNEGTLIRDATLPFLKENRISDDWTHNKTIQKARESYRITKEQKELLEKMKRK